MIAIPDEFEWLSPWAPIPADYKILPSFEDHGACTNWDLETGEILEPASQTLVAELKRELPIGHILEGLDFKTIAVCETTHQDFLFATNDKRRPLASVHLTFAKESKPPWPMTTIFATLNAWREEMKRDHTNYSRRATQST